ncbi:hypothetical protein NBO_81g0024 [Nosema bombycis CQ1]|uniref:Uncharacterized protein n=1 Tax=Nosema bombycis (strain CQ1 / CVCC 102059) TaxID=578461 RepID=R0KRF8_NOSB1|nr:hypothetical protein NBO_81g0024 [Nosema bombycis CQ1]|eukprot:EOB13331.1 hypothetical protein NBO_81g0024 [Nosema bombycis CQ1]
MIKLFFKQRANFNPIKLFHLILICICNNEATRKGACNTSLITKQPKFVNENSKSTQVFDEETSIASTESKTCREICLECSECFCELRITCTIYSALCCNFICNCCRFA